MDPLLGEIRVFPFTYAPQGWAPCNGQLLPISQNTPLFSLLGTQFGGDGQTNFALPNLNGRVIVGSGMRSMPYAVGNTGGFEMVTLQPTEMPVHMHPVVAHASVDTSSPNNNYLGNPTVPDPANQTNPNTGNANLYNATGSTVALMNSSVSPAGGNQPHENRQPYLVMMYCIALEGIYPSRS